MIFSTWIQVIDNESTLEEAPVPRFLSASDTLSEDTQTNSSQPSINYGSASNLLVGDYPSFTNARILANIPLMLNASGVLPSTAIVSEATLELRCQKLSVLDAGDTALYPARLLTDFDEANATHNVSDTGTTWNESGADGVGADRGYWEPGDMVSVTSNNQYRIFSLNLTSLVQDALRNGESNMSIVISGVGMPVFCASAEHPSSVRRPTIDFEYTMGAAPSQGSVLIAGPQNGEIIADPDELLIMPDYSPTISWNNLSSSDIEIQFSSSEDFRSVDDPTRLWNSWDDSSVFSMSSNEFYTPASEANLLNGTWVHFRMRSANNSILGPWVSGFFGLPAEIGELDGQEATIQLYNDTVNLGYGTIHDTWVMDGNISYNGDEDIRMRIGHSNDSTEGNMHAFFRVNMEQVPIHDNVTILDATLNVRRTDRTGEPMISAWMMHSNIGHVFEELNYANSSNGMTWTNGGADKIVENALLSTLNGNQSYSTLSFDATAYVQAYLHAGHTGDLDFILTGQGLAGEEMEIATGDELSFGHRPHFDITYSWGDGTPTPAATDITPAPNSAAWDVVNWELQSTTTPTLTWAPVSGADVIIELAEYEFGDS
ncbi:MAG: DNRLRE domain-containing protein, partial [Candidatus Poseidoniales archaeon]|nr:DNRLRE domain-containing protein [Candidatus Poseidoniales archaeon]